MPRFPLVFGMSLAWCCGHDAGSTPSPQGDGGRAQIGASGGSPAGAGAGSEPSAGDGPAASGGSASGGAPIIGGSASDASGASGSAQVGGSDAGSMAGGRGGEATSGVGGEGGSPAGGAGGSSGGSSVTSTLCSLVGPDPATASSKLGSLYRFALFSDCRYAALTCGVAPESKIELANGVDVLGLGLWHCNGSSATRFRLVYPGRSVTELDAQALIDLYVTLMLESLPFTPADGARISDELTALASARLDENAASISLCDSAGTWNGCGSTGGGTAGAGNAGAGNAGAGQGGASDAGGAGGVGGVGGAGNSSAGG